MFAPPPVVKARAFARIPDGFRSLEGTNRWIEFQRGGIRTDCFLEGPSFDRAGNLYIVDVAWGRIFRISPAGEVELFLQYDGEPNGLKIHADGRIFVADFRHGILVIDPSTRDVKPVLERFQLDRFKGVNDLIFDSAGNLYFTDQGMTGLHDPSGSLYRLGANGKLDKLLGNIPSPNGLVLNAAENIVYVNVTRGNCVWRVPLAKDGTPYKVGIFIQLSGGLGGPDGLAIDITGNLAIAHVGLGVVWQFSPLGEPLLRIESCRGLATTNVAYGGAENKTLFVTESESGTVLAVDMPCAGRMMYSHS